MSEFRHIPVLSEEVLELLAFAPGRPARMIDGTVGGGGHSALLLKKYPLLEVLAIDRDPAAIEAAKTNLAFAGDRVRFRRGESRRFERVRRAGDRVRFRRGEYADMGRAARENGWDQVEGILLDIGVSSPQIDQAERGFSWRREGPLDMRMDQSSPVTAGRILNFASEEELTRIFREYGELRSAAKLAHAAVERRKKSFFATTADLAALCGETLGRSAPGKLPLPTLVFQALRIAVNGELDQLRRGLEEGVKLLAPGGRIAVISFHSLEDRIVKEFFRKESTKCICPPGLPVCRCGHEASLSLPLRSRAVTASAGELERNPRAACAKLRIAEKLETI